MAFRLTSDRPRLPRRHPGGLQPALPLGPGGRRRRTMRRSAAVLPAMFTLGNALCGFMAIFMASSTGLVTPLPFDWSPLTFAAAFIFLGMVFDALDGRIARLTHSTSDLGVQLDSMADMVSFGVAPDFIAVQLVLGQLAAAGSRLVPFLGASGKVDTYFGRLALIVALIYVACAALRLARFNLEVKSPNVSDHMHFKGLPSPGAAGTVASLVLLHEHILRHPTSVAWASQGAAVVMVVVMLLVAFAMVSRLRYVHVMNRYVRGRAPFTTLAKFVVVGLLLSISLQWSLAAGFVIYALTAPASEAYRRVMGRKPAVPPRGSGQDGPSDLDPPANRHVG